MAIIKVQLIQSPEAAEQEASSILKSLGLDGLEWRAPHTLSSGQKKKAALAALLVSGPTLLLLDEPTAGLDGKRHAGLLNLLQNCLHLQNAAVIATRAGWGTQDLAGIPQLAGWQCIKAQPRFAPNRHVGERGSYSCNRIPRAGMALQTPAQMLDETRIVCHNFHKVLQAEQEAALARTILRFHKPHGNAISV